MSTGEIARTIAGLIQTQGEQAARAREASGAVWGGALRDIGQTVQQTIATATDPKRQELQRQQAGRAALTQALKTTPASADGTPDHKAIVAKVSAAGFPDIGEAWLSTSTKNAENLTTLDKMKRDAQTAAQNLQQKQLETIGDAAFHADTPEKFLASVGYLAAHGQLDEKTANGVLDQAQQPGPDGWKAVREQFLQHSPRWLDEQKERRKPVAIPRGGTATTAGAVQDAGGTMAGAPIPPTEAELALRASGNDPAKAMALLKPPPRPESAQTKSVLLDGKPSELTWEPQSKQWQDASGKPIENAAARIKPIPPASATMLLPTGDALTMAAKRYLATGELPSMGMGQAGAAARIAVMNEAAKIDPQASLAANAATFKADSANLKNLQTTEGTLSAFESTAGKNLDQFLALAAKVPDTGVPWLNAPIRTVNAKGLGNADQAAFNAARDVALREIARVTNDPKLSGVLSDSARHEVSALSPATATFAQIKKVAQVLKQDMANVHSSLTDQIATVKGTIDAHPGAASQRREVPGHPGTFAVSTDGGKTWKVQ